MLKLSSINQARIQKSCDPSVTYIQDDMAIHNFDRVVVNVSIGLDQYLMGESIIVNIRVSMTKKGYATITNKMHHLVTLKLLAMKLGIGLEKAKQTLKAKNGDCIRSSSLPLTRRHCTYLISKVLSRSSCTF